MLNLKKLLTKILTSLSVLGNTVVGTNTNVNTTASLENYVKGSTITLVPGTYIILGTAAFPNGTAGSRRVQIWNETNNSGLITRGDYGTGWMQLQVAFIVVVNTNTTYSCRISSSVALSKCGTGIRAVRVA